MPKCSTYYSKLLGSSIPQGVWKLGLYPIPPCELLTSSLLSHYSVVAIPSNQTLEAEPVNNDEIQAPISDEMFRKGAKLGSYRSGDSTFYSLIENYANSGDFRSLEQVLDRMKRERRVFIEKSFILMFRAFGKAHLPNKAIELFYRMVDEFQCRRTVKSFNSVLNVIIQEGLYSPAIEFYSRVVGTANMNISPNVLSYNLIIKAMCKFGLVDRAVELFREMPSRSCTPDVFTYCTLMDGLCKDNRIDEAVFFVG